MAFEKGNKVAVGNDGGRPEKYDYADYAKKLDEWSKLPSSLNLISFCAKYDLPGEYISRWSARSPVFRQSVNRARAQIADKMEFLIQSGRADIKIYGRMMGYYNDLVRKHERKEFAHKCKTQNKSEKKIETFENINVIDYQKANNG